MLFSATMPGPVVALARRFMNRPIHIRATDPDEGLTQANIKHVIYRAHSLDKDEVIARILQAEGRGKTIVFTRTKRAAAKLVEELNDRGFTAVAVHGDLNQEQRERAMAAFKAGKKEILIATDVAARGIDVNDVTHVINHTVPDDPDTYLHRAGRTGRAGKTGIAVTFVDWADMHKWSLINRGLDFGQPEPVETYSSSPHLFTDLDIPQGTKGRLKAASPTAPRGLAASARGFRASGLVVAHPHAHARRLGFGRTGVRVGEARRRHRNARRQGPGAPRRQRAARASPPSPRPARGRDAAAPPPSAVPPVGRSCDLERPRERALRDRVAAVQSGSADERLRARRLRHDRGVDLGARRVLAEPVRLARAVVVARPGRDEPVLRRELRASRSRDCGELSRWSSSRPNSPASTSSAHPPVVDRPLGPARARMRDAPAPRRPRR